MQINIVSVGKLSKDFQTIAADYEKMIRWSVKSTELTYSKKLPPNQIKQYEEKLIQEVLSEKSFKIALDVGGKHISSHEIASLLKQLEEEGKNIDFIIGGAFGLEQNILVCANLKLSLSKMTLPHQLAKVILLEQIYRAQTIITNHPYHK